MAHVVIEHFGQLPQRDPNAVPSTHWEPYSPHLAATVDGRQMLEVEVRMSWEAGINARSELERRGVWRGNPLTHIDQALLKYGMRRLEMVVSEMLAVGAPPSATGETWSVSTDEVDELLAYIEDKSCSYQVRQTRDLYCTAASPDDVTAKFEIGGRLSAPTSRPLCRACELPSNDLLCSHLLHPVVTNDYQARSVVDAMCDRGRDEEVSEPKLCRPGGHECWQRVVEVEDERPTLVTPLALPEAFDVLDAMWRLAFGRRQRLLNLSTSVGPAALALDCTNRPEFETRLSALADLIDIMKVDDSLLPTGLTDEQKNGSINRLSEALYDALPPEQHSALNNAIQKLRLVRQARNAMQHSKVDGGLTPKLRALGIHDAPPNWHDAWDTIRAHTADALGIIRHELRRWVDTQNT
ncbi:hypothetical protein GCM10009557_00770 [Virgisporangium ochraceum]|uniref:Uncharacterized protein n=1 Tax=Virgisporangium ochraceum TaxID=65505 RepID=A0A8J4EGQ3_9ACTN|nr:hypothetical protein [Virgisporangium ochraceum]GIJ74109.1 hypothetical protein Voc01_090260 [Virgisporangium ochraceum]